MKYRVIIRVGYQEACFDFETGSDACEFAKQALTHSVKNEDSKKATFINMTIYDPKTEVEE